MQNNRQSRPLNRRDFCRIAMVSSGAGLAAFAGRAATPATPEIAAKPDNKTVYPPGRYVDVHTHLGQTWNTKEALTAATLLGWMDAGDIAQAVVLPLVSPESSSYLLTSDFVLAETKPHRDRLVPFGHGPGWWASISGDASEADLGGYPKGPIAPGGALDALMDKHPNLYGDLSAGSGASAITRDPTFGREFLIRRADRLMFGTDFLAPGQDVPQLDLYRQLDLPTAVQAKIFRENARRVLGL